MAQKPVSNFVGRARSISVTLANGSPQLGMWQATGTAIAQAPNLTELREPETGGSNIEFDEHGHSTRIAKPAGNGDLELVKSITAGITPVPDEQEDSKTGARRQLHRTHTLREKQDCGVKAGWGLTILHGLKAFWKFFKTFSGFCITIYFLNIVVSRMRMSNVLHHVLMCMTFQGMGRNAFLSAPQSRARNEPPLSR